ncbi:MAG: amidohydrolase [Acidobacteriota bacterium]|nr:amidohydrolase [Acidobacteriota bacterium]
MKKLILLIIFGISVNFSVLAKQTSPELILYNGKIFTSDAAQPNAEAIAIRGERILAIGSNEEIKKLAGAKTRLIDLQNRIVTPGFNDAHNHFMPKPPGFHLQLKELEPGWAETVEAIKNAVKETPKGTWIFGEIGGSVLAESEANRATLDRIAPDNPVLLETYFGHGLIVNSKAMKLLKISENEVHPLGGFFEYDAITKKINGRIFEYAHWRQVRLLAELTSDADAVKRLKQKADDAVRFGITSMQIMPTMRIEKFVRLLEKADLPIRVRAMPFSLTTEKERDLSEIRGLSRLKTSNAKINASGIKGILDGTPIERGAALRKDYNDKPGWRGRLNFSESEIENIIKESLKFNQPLLLHCVGDRACEAAFDAMEKIGNGKIDWTKKRVHVEHGEMVIDDLLERAKKLGVVIVQNPTHFTDGELGRARWGGGKSRIRSMIETGVPFALGSDGPINPFLNITLASIHPDNPPQAISREQAVRAYTFGSAYAEFAETQKGVLAKGKLADLAVLSQDIFSVSLDELPKTQSILTMVGGKIVHDAKILK